MIANIHYQKLRIGEFIQFLDNSISICKNNDPVALEIDTTLNPLEESLGNIEAVFNKERGSKLTEDIIVLNKRRDNAIKLLTLHAKGYSRYCFEEAKRQAAEKIYKAITKYGHSIYRLNYQAETSTLSILVNELLSDPGLARAVNTLDLQPAVNELETANELFNDKYLSRVIDMADMAAESASAQRKTAMKHYRRLIKLIEALAVVSGQDRYQSLINELNELIETYNEEADSRAGNNKTKAEGE
ncbi:MAG: hypothetical protein KGY69_18075 [Bacteroidales bacterium]|nr:hypothetical protein [Bacteroidales bacterium]